MATNIPGLEQRLNDEARDQAGDDETRRTLIERQKILDISATSDEHWQRHQSAVSANAETVGRTTTSQHPPEHPIHNKSQQPATSSSYAEIPDYVAEFKSQRSLTASTVATQLTRFTHFSFSRKSTASSNSSWSDVESLAPKPGPTPPQDTWQADSPRRG